MPKKVRELIRDLAKSGWRLEQGGKGSHRKFSHPRVNRKMILSGQDGADAKRYQEKKVREAVEDADAAKQQDENDFNNEKRRRLS